MFCINLKRLKKYFVCYFFNTKISDFILFLFTKKYNNKTIEIHYQTNMLQPDWKIMSFSSERVLPRPWLPTSATKKTKIDWFVAKRRTPFRGGPALLPSCRATSIECTTIIGRKALKGSCGMLSDAFGKHSSTEVSSVGEVGSIAHRILWTSEREEKWAGNVCKIANIEINKTGHVYWMFFMCFRFRRRPLHSIYL